MLKDFTISNLLDLNETIAAELFRRKNTTRGSASGSRRYHESLVTTSARLSMSAVRAISGSQDQQPLHRLLIFMDRRSSEKTQKYVTVHLSVEMQS